MRALRAAAAVVVLALLGLLVWDVSHTGRGGVASKVDRGESVAAPHTSLPFFGQDGKFDLASYRGKVVVLNFWASWCIDCKLEAKTLHDAAAKWKSDQVVFIGVDGSDLTGSARRYMDRYAVNYDVVRDVGGDAQSTWGVTAFPETFIVDRSGRVIPPHVEGPIPADRLAAAIRRALAS
jgi:cytochrome c biogenesis protein CcmG, thiol:disulfide interchange protein DsbE